MGGERHPDGVAAYPASAEQLQAFERASARLGGFRAPLLLREDSGDRLFVAAFDGSGNSLHRDPPAKHTNVAWIHQQLERRIADDTRASGASSLGAGYVEGVGTQGGLAGAVDLVTGRSYEARLEEMYLQFIHQAKRWIDANPGADIRLVSIGFSRGAEQAAGFTRLVEERGIQNPTGADVVRGRDGLIDRIVFTAPPLREPGSVVQAIGLFDPVGTGTPLRHDRRPAASVVSGYQLTAEDERRNPFPGTHITDPGITFDGRFLNELLPGAHSDMGGGYERNGLSIRAGNLMANYVNALAEEPLLRLRPVPPDPAMSVIHRSEQHFALYRTSQFDRNGVRSHRDELAPPALCRIDCRDAEPRNEAMAASLQWRQVAIAPAPAAPALAVSGPVERMLEAARRDDARAIDLVSRDFLAGPAGQAWLAAGEDRLRAMEAARGEERQRPPAALELER